MANQQILFAETIAAMKKAFKRKAYESDSDSDIEHYGNRGHKLQKRARFSGQGQLLPAEGPGAYKETLDYAGVRRSIINRNPPLVDEDGYEVDSGDDDDRIEDAMLSAAELNPYANVRIENILAPLTNTTDLPTHPTLSKPFTSSTLTTLVAHSNEMLRKENMSLWQVRHLWTALCGDHMWAPCDKMVGPNNVELFTEDWVARQLMNLKTSASNEGSASGSVTNGHNNGQNGEHTGSAEQAPATIEDADVSMADAETAKKGADGTAADSEAPAEDVDKKDFSSAPENKDSEEVKRKPLPNGKATKSNDTKDAIMSSPQTTQLNGHSANEVQVPGATTDGDNSGHPANPLDAFIHPIFEMPAGSRPDRDFGIPEQEAEDVRRLLSLFIQKQEEVCRGVKKLYSGLNKAERLRKSVLHWSKAEAHCGANRDMSDGEDWYDKEEWGLADDLKKGQDDEEEDTTTAGKKTRNRRAN